MRKRYRLRELFGFVDKRDDLIEEISKHVKILVDRAPRFHTWHIYLESKKGKCAYIVYDWVFDFAVAIIWSLKRPIREGDVRMFCNKARKLRIVISDDNFSLVC